MSAPEDHGWSRFECLDCGTNTAFSDEYYMVHDTVWDSVVKGGGMLCIGCLEGRLGRTLTPQDFTLCMVNLDHRNYAKSERLLNRLGVVEEV